MPLPHSISPAQLTKLWRIGLSVALMGAFSPAPGQQKPKAPSTTTITNESGGVQMTIHYSPACDCKTYTEYYGNKKILARRVFKTDGRIEYVDGKEETFYEDGTLQFERIWVAGVPEGRAFYNHPNGKLKKEEFYQNGYKHGVWSTYDASGNLMKTEAFPEGTIKWDSKAQGNTAKALANRVVKQDGALSGISLSARNMSNLPKDGRAVDGANLFSQKCRVCHSMTKNGYGPALGDVRLRRNPTWIRAVIVNGPELMSNGDTAAKALAKRHPRVKQAKDQQMVKEEVDALIQYLLRAEK